MIKIKDGIFLFHGSYTPVSKVDLSVCNSGLDFGKGFYLTASFEQAYKYVPLAVKKARMLGRISKDFLVDDGYISVFKFHYDPNLLIHCFYSADSEWLHFVSANRKPELFPALLKKYETTDIVMGKIADDQTARTLQQYINEYYGVPGSPEADKDAIKRLLPNRLENQYCFRTLDAVKSLEFIRSDRYGDVK